MPAAQDGTGRPAVRGVPALHADYRIAARPAGRRPRRAATRAAAWPGAPGSRSSGTCGRGPRSASERSVRPAQRQLRLRPPPASPRRTALRRGDAACPARSGPHPVATDPAVRARLPRREQPRGLLVSFASQRQVRHPDQYPRDQGRMPRFGSPPGRPRRGARGPRRGLRPGSRAGRGSVARMCGRSASSPSMVGRDAELPARLLGVAAPSGPAPPWPGPARPAQSATSTRSAYRCASAHGRRAPTPLTQQPVQLSLPRPHPDHVLDGADLGDHRDRLFVVLARGRRTRRAWRSGPPARSARTKSPTARRAPGTRRAPSRGRRPPPARPGRA